MSIADHAIAARAISVPEEGAVAQISVLGTVIIDDLAATGLELADVAAATVVLRDLAASGLELADARASTVVISDALAGSAESEVIP